MKTDIVSKIAKELEQEIVSERHPIRCRHCSRSFYAVAVLQTTTRRNNFAHHYDWTNGVLTEGP
jgi:hypothetical protein